MYGRKGGWLTAEYSMLPGSTHTRKPRDGRTGRPLDGRSQEIQRLIGRALRGSLNLSLMPEITLWVDCDVISADGGTRTTAINGASVALYDALLDLEERKQLRDWPLRGTGLTTATSVGIVNGDVLVDLDYKEDSNAEVDMNVVCNGDGDFLEIQGTAEGRPFSPKQLQELTEAAHRSCADMMEIQKQALGI